MTIYDELAEQGTWDGHKFKVTPVVSYDPRLADLSYLKAGYLAAFASLGYRYILREELDLVRRQLAQPENNVIPRYSISLPRKEESARKMISVTSPFTAIAVQIDRTIILLPPVETSEEFYSGVSDMLQAAVEAGQTQGRQWDFPTTLHLYLDQHTTTPN